MCVYRNKEKFLKPSLQQVSNQTQLLVSIDLKSFTIARINSMSTKLERLPIVQLQVAHSILFLIDRPDQKWARCKRGFITLYPVSRVFYTHVIDLWLRVFSLFLSFSTKWNARVERQFRVSDYIAKIDLYALGTTYLSAARKNHKIRFFDRRHRDPWNIIYIYIVDRCFITNN